MYIQLVRILGLRALYFSLAAVLKSLATERSAWRLVLIFVGEK